MKRHMEKLAINSHSESLQNQRHQHLDLELLASWTISTLLLLFSAWHFVTAALKNTVLQFQTGGRGTYLKGDCEDNMGVDDEEMPPWFRPESTLGFQTCLGHLNWRNVSSSGVLSRRSEKPPEELLTSVWGWQTRLETTALQSSQGTTLLSLVWCCCPSDFLLELAPCGSLSQSHSP